MGFICSKLAVDAPAPAPVPRYRSAACRTVFREYAWPQTSWTCVFCRAQWAVREATFYERREDDQTRGELKPIVQIAEHNGGQVEEWQAGAGGLCVDCKVFWEQM